MSYKKIAPENESLSVLVVDNDAEDRRSLVRILAQLSSDVSIRECKNSAEAYSALTTESFDVALVTHELPDELATDLLARLKQEGKLQTPIILLTETDDVGEDVIRLGAHEFLSKQARTVQQLRKSVRYSLERHRLWAELQASKARQQRELELRSLEEGRGRHDNGIILDETIFDRQVEELTTAYRRIFEVFSSDASYKREPEAPELIRDFASKLGLLGCGPKELVRIHRNVLEKLVQDKTTMREESLTNESRYMLLQVMGELLLYYRDRAKESEQHSGI